MDTRKRGWQLKVKLGDVFHDEALTFEERRDAIVRRIKETGWFKEADKEQTDLVLLIEELSETDEPDAFDLIWDAIYDVADADRVWIETWTP